MNGINHGKTKPVGQVLIVGGGIAGISAAKALDTWGAMVHLVERKESLGGHSCEWPCMATDICQNCGACLGADWKNRAQQFRNVKVYLETEIVDIQRIGDQFEVSLKGKQASTLSADAVLLATGFEPFDPSSLESLNYRAHHRVITTCELNRLILNEGLAEFIGHQESPRFGFIQCIGSRNREQGRDYCSQVCCKVALRQANKVLDLIPHASMTLYYMDLQIIGKEFRSQFNRIRDRVRLIQGTPAEILTDYEPEMLTVIQEDEKSGRRAAQHFDSVILSVGMVPAAGSGKIGQLLGTRIDSWGFYGGKDARLPDRVYAAGAAQAPTDILSAKEQGLTAARAIARDLEILTDRHQRPCAAILGNGPQSMWGASALAAQGYPVKLLDTGKREFETGKGVRYFPSTQVLGLSGSVGEYTMTLRSGLEVESIRADAIIVATEAGREQPSAMGLDFGSHPILGLESFENNLNEAPESIPGRIVFFLDVSGPEWKENARRSLLLSSRAAEKKKDVSILMKNMLVHGPEGQRLYDSARRKGVKFLRMPEGEPPLLSSDQDGLSLVIHETTLGPVPVTLHCDLLVIPEAVHPSRENPFMKEILKIEADEEGYVQSCNVRHRLLTGPRKGIFFLGSCHDETDETDLKHEISGIGAHLDLIMQGSYPIEDTLAEISAARCVRCLTCLRICPHGAVFLKDAFQPCISANACFGCGLCVAACPAGAIDQDTDLKTIHPAPVYEQETVVFACERSAALAEKEARRLGLASPERVHVISVPCAGRVPVETMLAPFLGKTERVLILGCHQGNCRSGIGGTMASKRVHRIVKDAGLSERQLKYQSIAANEPYKMIKIISDSSYLGKDREDG